MLMNEEKTNADRKEQGIDNLHLKPDTKDKILLIDADTIVYAVCSVCEFVSEEKPDPKDNVYDIDLDIALEMAQERVAELLYFTGCKSAELHFTSGKNFRYTVKPDYKSNRGDTRYPVGLRELKALMTPLYPNSLINSEVEADDMVCMLKRVNPTKYIVCAVDKDVIYGVPGTHFNYFKREKSKNKYGTELKQINMKWVYVEQNTSIYWPYFQCLMGDSADGIGGVPKVGPGKAIDLLCPTLKPKVDQLKKEWKEEKGKAISSDKLLTDLVIPNNLLDSLHSDETKLWNTVVQAYRGAGLTEKDSISTMRLVHMHQINDEGDLQLWTQPTE